jgi:hypothetical protein
MEGQAPTDLSARSELARRDSNRSVILTDSMSIVSKIQRMTIKKTIPDFQISYTSEAAPRSMYIPGHTGIRYNERADRLAGGAVPFGNLEMTAAVVVDSATKSIHENEELLEHTGACKGCMRRRSNEEKERTCHCVETNNT